MGIGDSIVSFQVGWFSVSYPDDSTGHEFWRRDFLQKMFSGFIFVRVPFPVANLRQILAVLVNVVFVFDELILHLLFQVVAFGA